MSKRKKQRKKQHDPVKLAKGAARRAHFEGGGDLAMWRGNARTFCNRRQLADKGACRVYVSAEEE